MEGNYLIGNMLKCGEKRNKRRIRTVSMMQEWDMQVLLYLSVRDNNNNNDSSCVCES